MLKQSFHTPGTAPASLILHGPPGEKAQVRLIHYGPDFYKEEPITDVGELLQRCTGDGVQWVGITGIHDVELLRRVGEHFGLHPLSLEDVLNIGQRPKLEEYPDHFFIVSQMVNWQAGRVEFWQASIFLKKNVLITIQEPVSEDQFEPVRRRLVAGRGFARSRGHDYLAYALLDAVIDHFFPVLEEIGERLEEFETRMLDQPSRELAGQLHDMKRALLQLRRNLWPQREVLNSLLRDDAGLVSDDVKVFLRDCYDHVIQLMDVVESYRDVAGGLIELYLSTISMRTNEIMRVLTIISSIFIPLSFLAGVYGMNFENMPELKQPYAYFIVLGVMAAVAGGMLSFFKYKRWL